MSLIFRPLLPHPLFSVCRRSPCHPSRAFTTAQATTQAVTQTSTPNSASLESTLPSSQSSSTDLPQSAAFTPAYSLSPSSSASANCSSEPSSSSPHIFEPLTYHVHRTPSQQLPIYHLAKRGGSLHQTKIRKISGSSADLRRDLMQELGLEEKSIAVNAVNGDVVLKGWKKHEVARFLEGKYF